MLNRFLPPLLVLLLPAGGLRAQSFRRGGTEFEALRQVSILKDKSYSVVVTEFFHHGLINARGGNVAVAAGRGELVPWRVLQLGPGDFCRLAFQPLQRENRYDILYGGQPPKNPPPPWTARDGLLLETRRYKRCDLTQLDSVREAFNSARPFGAGYVDAVHHARNPFSLRPLPFMSRYSGYLYVPSAGTYGFFTSSRDRSFLLIDGKEVVSARRVRYRARPGTRKDVQLSAGLHKFEYYHVATGPNAVMAAAWEVSPGGDKPRPAAIPPEVFRTRKVAHLPAGSVSLRTRKLVPDFVMQIAGDVPLPGNSVPLIGVSFKDRSPRGLSSGAKVRWEFGDGQTANRAVVDHVYLRPGTYAVKLSLRRGGRTVQMVNRVQVDRPALTAKDKDKFHKLDDYLPVLEGYDPKTLDAASLRQLVLAYQAKAEALHSQAKERRQKPEDGPQRPPRDRRRTADEDLSEARPYLTAAVEAGKTALLEGTAKSSDQGLHRLATLVGPLARERLGDSQAAWQIWRAAADKIKLGQMKADCQIEAADVAINDLAGQDDAKTAAKTMLDAAGKHLGTTDRGPVAAKLQRVWGDYYALTNQGKKAREAYRRAEQRLGRRRTYISRTAWRGTHSRSSEEFIRQGRYDRAAGQLRQWQDDFPADKIDGYLTLLYARYWAGRQKYAQAVAQAEQLQAVNPDSPYADQLLWLAADCEQKRGQTDRATATLHALLKDYPGSPLVDEVRKRLAELQNER